MSNYHGLGFFICESGNLVVSDPCYGRKHLEDDKRNLNIATILHGVLVGRYGAVVRRHRDTNKDLTIWHLDSYEGQDVTRLPWLQYSGEGGEKQNLVICVDSGQAGFFEETKYPKTEDNTGDSDDKSSFYGIACYITSETAWGAGIIGASPTTGMGVVSQSGQGDGGYTLYVQRDVSGNIIAARLDFVDETADEDDEEDDYADGDVDVDVDVDEDEEIDIINE